MPQSKSSGDPKLRLVPSVDQLLRTPTAVELRETLGVKRTTALARTVTAELRSAVRNGQNQTDKLSAESLLEHAAERLRETATLEGRNGIKKVINATGVILHTNLGRAPLSVSTQNAIVDATRYCAL